MLVRIEHSAFTTPLCFDPDRIGSALAPRGEVTSLRQLYLNM